jgi:hypothetical protein
VGDRRLSGTPKKFECNIWLCPKGKVLRNAAVPAAFLEFVTCRPILWKIYLTAKRPSELIGIVVITRNSEDTIDTNLTGGEMTE